MFDGKSIVRSEAIADATNKALVRRGVDIVDIAKIVYEMQSEYNEELKLEQCVDSVQNVLKKRELQHAILVGIELDELCEKGMLSSPLQEIVESDEGLFGVDETIALGGVFTYGSIAVTTFGHLDKNKIGIIHDLDTKKGEHVHTFLDDLVATVASCAAARIAHRSRDLEEAGLTFEDVKDAAK